MKVLCDYFFKGLTWNICNKGVSFNHICKGSRFYRFNYCWRINILIPKLEFKN